MRLKQLAQQWIIPPNLFQILKKANIDINRFFTDNYSGDKYGKLLGKNAKLAHRFKGERCFVIGNGPCLNNHDLSLIPGEDISIVMNSFNQHPILSDWQPTFYCVAEPLANLSNPHETLTEMLRGLKPNAYFFRTEYSDFFADFPIDTTNVHYMRTKGDYTTHDSIDFTSIVPESPNTSVMATMLAIWLGCSPIHLIGFNYDWLATNLHHHFYEEETKVDMSKFLPSYLQRIRHADPHWAAHEKLYQIASKKGQKIYISDCESFLDAYPYSRSITQVN